MNIKKVTDICIVKNWKLWRAVIIRMCDIRMCDVSQLLLKMHKQNN